MLYMYNCTPEGYFTCLHVILCCIPEGYFNLANIEEPDEIQHYAAFHLGIHCLTKYPFSGFLYTKG